MKIIDKDIDYNTEGLNDIISTRIGELLAEIHQKTDATIQEALVKMLVEVMLSIKEIYPSDEIAAELIDTVFKLTFEDK